MRVVLDTNVLVSGLLKPHGAPGEIVRMASAGALQVCYDSRILIEYREVMLRPRFGFPENRVEALLDEIKACGHTVSGGPLKARLPDRDDEPFLEAAIAGEADYLITGNIKDYPASAREGIAIVSAAQFLEAYRRLEP